MVPLTHPNRRLEVILLLVAAFSTQTTCEFSSNFKERVVRPNKNVARRRSHMRRRYDVRGLVRSGGTMSMSMVYEVEEFKSDFNVDKGLEETNPIEKIDEDVIMYYEFVDTAEDSEELPLAYTTLVDEEPGGTVFTDTNEGSEGEAIEDDGIVHNIFFEAEDEVERQEKKRTSGNKNDDNLTSGWQVLDTQTSGWQVLSSKTKNQQEKVSKKQLRTRQSTKSAKTRSKSLKRSEKSHSKGNKGTKKSKKSDKKSKKIRKKM